MEDFLYYNNLYLYYKDLLTDKENQVFNDYYSEDLSMQEIAENNMVSRSAIHKTIKVVKEKLDNYENKLHLCEINNKLNELLNCNDIKTIKDEINILLEK
ncbi:MAG: HTH domain-containing protein [Bacilli bacterium]|nr:HTH domain-containing protein [Bacilli bacterium]